MYHSNALLLPDGRVLTAGGGRAGSAPTYPNAEFYSPQYLALGGRPAITSTSPVWTSGAKATLTVSSANGVSSVVLMGLPAVTHGIDTAARRLVLPVTSPWNAGTGSIEVQVPSVFKAPPGHYYAIALDSRGVPSHAPIVQVLGSTGPAPAMPAGTQPEVARTVADPTPSDPD
jgi:hypothetical protein